MEMSHCLCQHEGSTYGQVFPFRCIDCRIEDEFATYCLVENDVESPAKPESDGECSFGCLRPLKRKRGFLLCGNCNNIVECCFVCAESNDNCTRCAPTVRAAKAKEAIREIAERVRIDGYCFSHINFENDAPDQWAQCAEYVKGIVANTIAVKLTMDGHHMENGAYVDQQIDFYHSISTVSADVDMQEKLATWAETYQFDNKDLANYLTYEPDPGKSTGYWTDTYYVTVYNMIL